MIATLASLTFRGLLNRRRTLLLALVGALLLLIAVLSRLSGGSDADSREFTGRLLADFGLGVLLPLVAVIIGTAAIGSELEDGTLVYLLAKPIPRIVIVAVKLVVAWLVVLILTVPAIVLAGFAGTGGDAELGAAYGTAALVAGAEYTAVFLALSLITSRALVVGLAYVVIWEGVVAALFAGTRIFSVRQHGLAVADAIGREGAVAADLGVVAALGVAILITLAAFAIGVRRLERVELRGETG